MNRDQGRYLARGEVSLKKGVWRLMSIMSPLRHAVDIVFLEFGLDFPLGLTVI